MTKMTIHGGIKLLGASSEIANLELEELLLDPVNPELGRVWINTPEGRVKYASVKDGVVVIQALSTLEEVSEMLPAMLTLVTAMVNTQTVFADRLAFS